MQSNLPKEILKLIGMTYCTDLSPITVQKGLWQNFCAAIEDGNPLYWDNSTSKKYTDSLIAHPALLPSWAHDFQWHPKRKIIHPMQLHFYIKDSEYLLVLVISQYSGFPSSIAEQKFCQRPF